MPNGPSDELRRLLMELARLGREGREPPPDLVSKVNRLMEKEGVHNSPDIED